jgi:hypothetical protein
MNEYPINRFFGILILTLFSFSCSSDLDFNQVNDLKVEPIFVANLSYFNIPASDFVENGVEQRVAIDAEDFDVFRDAFFRDNLKRADFDFEITNTINRAFSLDVIFLDQNDQPLHTIRFNMLPYDGSPNILAQTEIFENAKLDLLKSTRRLGFVLNMISGPSLSESSVGSLKLRSSVTVYLGVE